MELWTKAVDSLNKRELIGVKGSRVEDYSFKLKLTTCSGKECLFNIDNRRHEKVDVDIEKVYFKCERCQREYVAYYLDAEIRSMQAEMKTLLKPNMKRKDIKKSQKLRKQIGTEMNELRTRMER